jgi:3-hydroxymyristoyl/3-hydroxydecanoyl-(acyl carrier protein) dehydratase
MGTSHKKMTDVGTELPSELKTWYLLSDLRTAPDGTLKARVRIPELSAWFSGHFPSRPVLPGIAHIAMVMDVLRKAHGSQLTAIAVKRLRFRLAVGPNDELWVTVHPTLSAAGRTTYSFQTTRDTQTACTGGITVEG